MHNRTAGPLAYTHIYYTMKALCYDCWSDAQTKEQIWLCALWASALPGYGVRFWIPENRASLALLADIELVPRPKLDYYI
jgi:hypothetical protein